mmetsp:Transcript_6059/g.5471  ORF Transcript_6059/g.5471 Transcript_6059/m.5471 type:complete len:203 (-) Transcript_6059:317-925(-)
MGPQNIQKNKKKMSHFLYNKSKFIRNLILANKFLIQAMNMFQQYTISSNSLSQDSDHSSKVSFPVSQILQYSLEEFEMISRLYYMFYRCHLENKSVDINRVILGNVPLDKISEGEFSQHLGRFETISNDFLIDLRSVLCYHKNLKKIHKQVFQKVLEVLNIQLVQSAEDDDAKLLNFEAYLKLRYFFIDKKASHNEFILLIS